MPRGRQPRQGAPRRKGPKAIVRIARQPRTNVVDILLPFTLTTTASTLTVVQVGYTQVGSLPRILSLSEVFLCIKFKSFRYIPTNLAAAQFLEIACIPRHLPYNPDSADGIPPTPASLASIATLPGYKRYNQGNGQITPKTTRLRAAQMRIDRFLTDQPSLLDVCYYSGNITILNCMLAARVSGLKYDV